MENAPVTSIPVFCNSLQNDFTMSAPTRYTGLSSAEAQQRLEQYGPNEIQGKPPKTRLQIFAHQFADAMVIILLAAAVVSFIAGEPTDAYVILAIIVGNALLGYHQEYSAEQSIQKLQRMAPMQVTVIRDGVPRGLPAAELVPGDVVTLEAGALVPADARLLELHALKTEEAALTGESVAVEKRLAPVPPDAPLAERIDTVFKGTYVSNGTAVAEVTATGMSTELGKIAAMLGGERGPTPLQRRLGRFGRVLAVVVLAICAVIFGLGLWRGEPPLQMFLTALSLAVAALPEALPAVVTIALAKGATALAKQNALVRRLPVVEALGSVTYICSDKTGTLTENKMTVERVGAVQGKEDLLHAAMLLSTEVAEGKDGQLLGDSTEVALVRYVLENRERAAEMRVRFPIEEKLPFDSDRMRMTTVHRAGDRWLLLVKGAPVKMVEALHTEESEMAKAWLEKNRAWASEGLRVLFFAARYLDAEPTEFLPDILERDLQLLGAVGMIDPPREEVTGSILECRNAGITPVMITGDQPLTAEAIARRLNILSDDSPGAMTGAQLAALDEAGLREAVGKTRVYARVSPEQKLTIVRALQERGEAVAMTGDGVNDAPSLKRADIGVAMGITGTDVSKEAAGMILLDDNFATIVRAVREGRRIYANIRKFVQYVLACNGGEILVLFLAPFLGLLTPLAPIHILWINLVTDGVPGIALVSEKPDPDLMRRPPRPPHESLFAGGMVGNILYTAVVLAVASLGAQVWAVRNGYDHAAQQSLVFTVLCLAQLGNALSVRAGQRWMGSGFFSNPLLLLSILLTIGLQAAVLYVPALAGIFKTVPLDGAALGVAVLFSLGSLVMLEALKAIALIIHQKDSLLKKSLL
jgi:Ca2+-transporting ATPase